MRAMQLWDILFSSEKCLNAGISIQKKKKPKEKGCTVVLESLHPNNTITHLQQEQVQTRPDLFWI